MSYLMLAATLLALAAAVLHAGWNLWVKQSEDRWIALWGQMTCAGIMCAVLLVALGGAHNIAWWPVIASASIHLVYVGFLARAYNLGDFSVTYPIARGAGALLAAIGGVIFLSDSLTPLMMIGIAIAVVGILLLAGPADNSHVQAALMVSLTIGAYSVIDSHGSRQMGGNLYPLLLFMGTGITLTAFGVVTHRRHDMTTALRRSWKKFSIAGAASVATYWMVLIAVQKAPVGYVTALRESSVVIVALVGTRYLGEKDMKRRVFAACIVVAGLGVLIVGR
ncbi:MAG: EamA family transporter [Actinobacteria bacterium]|nr:EamA family transporter [Actinomycetota bacterium]